MDVLRFATAGSVDDGKSSLIGRLLYDSKNLFEDQLAAVERASAQRGAAQVELALLTDGLRAEREQNITIDVAYRYFTTPKRKFIIADTPGHVQFTRNMVTGVSRVDLSVILIDAAKGILPQSRRHTAVSALFRVPKIVAAVNKMDLVGFSQQRFEALSAEFAEIAKKLGATEITIIPVSALLGDNVVDPSLNMEWYQGKTLLQHLETVETATDEGSKPFRMFVQNVIRGEKGYRGLTGKVASGSVAVGEKLALETSGAQGAIYATVGEVYGLNGPTESGSKGEAISIRLEEEVDAGRGTLLSNANQKLHGSTNIHTVVCWMGEKPAVAGDPVILVHGTRRVSGRIDRIESKIDVETLESGPTETLITNDLGKLSFTSSEPLFVEPYSENRETGSFLVVDPGTWITVGAAIVEAGTDLASGERPELTYSKVRIYGPESLVLTRQIGQSVTNLVILDEETLAKDLNSDLPTISESHRRIEAVANLLIAAGKNVVIRYENLPGQGLSVIDSTEPSALSEALSILIP